SAPAPTGLHPPLAVLWPRRPAAACVTLSCACARPCAHGLHGDGGSWLQWLHSIRPGRRAAAARDRAPEQKEILPASPALQTIDTSSWRSPLICLTIR